MSGLQDPASIPGWTTSHGGSMYFTTVLLFLEELRGWLIRIYDCGWKSLKTERIGKYIKKTCLKSNTE